MVERAGGAGLALQSAHALRIPARCERQEFQRRLPAQPRVVGEIDCPHSAATQFFDQAVVADHLAAETLRIIV